MQIIVYILSFLLGTLFGYVVSRVALEIYLVRQEKEFEREMELYKSRTRQDVPHDKPKTTMWD